MINSRALRYVPLQVLLVSALSQASAQSQSLPTAEQFDSSLRTCAAGQHIELNADIIGSISSLYNDQRTQGAVSFKDQTEFLSLMPEGARLEAYRLYVDCIRSILQPVSPTPPPPVTVTYTVCSGEYERACQPHDAYLYCNGDVHGWAQARCASFTTTRVNTYGGNKCGYAIDRVICTGPK